MIDEAWAQMEQEQQEEMQAWVQAITVMQGSGMPGPSAVPAGLMLRACERCMVLLRDPEGCMVSEKGKAWACMPCQKACKAYNWPLGLAEVAVTTSSGMEGSGKPAPRCMVKQRMATTMNTLPRGREKCKKVHTMMKEGEEDEDTKEVFGVPRAMVEE